MEEGQAQKGNLQTGAGEERGQRLQTEEDGAPAEEINRDLRVKFLRRERKVWKDLPRISHLCLSF